MSLRRAQNIFMPKNINPITITALFINMRTLKFKAQPTNAFFANVNQIFSAAPLVCCLLCFQPRFGQENGAIISLFANAARKWRENSYGFSILIGCLHRTTV